MLRKKLLVILGSVVILMVAATIAAILLLQGAVQELDGASKEHFGLEDRVAEVESTVTQVELELRELQLKKHRHLDEAIETLELLLRQCDDVARDYAFPEGKAAAEKLHATLEELQHHVSALATTEDAALAAEHMDKALEAVAEVRQRTLAVGELLHGHVAQQSRDVAWRLRMLVQGLAVLFLVLINVSALVLLRVATMILRPMDQLIEASRQLGQEKFMHRVKIDQKDEFEELAKSYNHLAEQLESNEQKKLQMLSQVAVTLNHELNNAGAIIEMQLKLMGREAASPAFEKCLRQIRESLARMTRTVEALKKVRRIVLTDYAEGTQMLDLERSVEEDVAKK